jgi:hypothetical protein
MLANHEVAKKRSDPDGENPPLVHVDLTIGLRHAVLSRESLQ